MDNQPQKPFDPDTSGPLKPQEKLLRVNGYLMIALTAISMLVLIVSWLVSGEPL